jgi:hypothetical protein
MVDRALAGAAPASELNYAELVAAVKRLLLEGFRSMEIMYRLDLSPSTYEGVKQFIEDERFGRPR